MNINKENNLYFLALQSGNMNGILNYETGHGEYRNSLKWVGRDDTFMTYNDNTWTSYLIVPLKK